MATLRVVLRHAESPRIVLRGFPLRRAWRRRVAKVVGQLPVIIFERRDHRIAGHQRDECWCPGGRLEGDMLDVDGVKTLVFGAIFSPVF